VFSLALRLTYRGHRHVDPRSCPFGYLEYDRLLPLAAVCQLTPLRFLPLRRSSWSSPLYLGLPRPVRSAFRFSQPLSGLLLDRPRNLVSCSWRPWGLPLEGFPLHQSVLLSKSLPSCRWPVWRPCPRSEPRAVTICPFAISKQTAWAGLDFRGFPWCKSVWLPVVLPTRQARSSFRLGGPLRISPSLCRLLEEVSFRALGRNPPNPPKQEWLATAVLRSVELQRNRLVSSRRLPPFLGFLSFPYHVD